VTRTAHTCACARFALGALVGLTPAIAQPSTITHHNDVAVYAIDADPATGTMLIGTPLAGNGPDASGGAKFEHVVSGFGSHCNYRPCFEPMGPR
jgi:hypothetical protein